MTGPELVDPCYGANIVTSPDGKGVIMTGCAGHPESIYELKEVNAGQLMWTKWNKTLTYPRYFTQAMLIPDELVNC